MASEPKPGSSRQVITPSNRRVLLDEERILLTLEEDISTDPSDDESNYGSDVDPIEERADDNNRNTDTEQSGSEVSSDDETSDEDVPLLYRGQFFGKDGTTSWKIAEPSQSIRTRQRNIVVHFPGTKGEAKNAKKPLEAWQCFMPDEVVQKIVGYTNLFIDLIKSKYSRDRDCKKTTVEETKALFGLLYYAGVLKASHLNAEELWEEVQLFKCVMSLQRFRFLLRMLRFDDKNTRVQRLEVDKLAPFREVFDFVVKKCQANFSAGECTTIDEMLWAFRGRCRFRQYMRNKPAKYGLKVFSLVDSKTFYVINMEVYLGKQLSGPYEHISQTPSPVVVRLLEPISGSNRNVTYDNWFSSISLSNDLLKNHKLTTVATIRKNKKEIPPQFLTTKNREVNSSMFGFGKNLTTLVSYVPKKGKVVLLTSNMHHSKKIDNATGEQKKPEIITFYNFTKGGVDVVDEMCGNYSVARKTNRWPLTAFYHILDIIGLNSLIISSWNDKEIKLVRRKWLKELAKELVTPHLRTRLHGPLSKVTRISILDILKEDIPRPPVEEEVPNKRKRCGLCDRQGNKSAHNCASCNIPVCGKHSKPTCLSCLDME